MKKLLLVLLVSSMLLLSIESVSAYNYKGREITITVPENIEYLEYKYITGQYVPKRIRNIIRANILLVQRGYKKLY